MNKSFLSGAGGEFWEELVGWVEEDRLVDSLIDSNLSIKAAVWGQLCHKEELFRWQVLDQWKCWNIEIWRMKSWNHNKVLVLKPLIMLARTWWDSCHIKWTNFWLFVTGVKFWKSHWNEWKNTSLESSRLKPNGSCSWRFEGPATLKPWGLLLFKVRRWFIL